MDNIDILGNTTESAIQATSQALYDLDHPRAVSYTHLLIIPSLVGVTGYGILQYYLMIYERDTGKNLIDTYGFYGALSLSLIHI